MSSTVLSRNEVTEVNLNDIYRRVRNCYDEIWQIAKFNGRLPKIYLHWSAGNYSQFWDDYHIQIDFDGKVYVPNDVEMSDVLAGTWQRNSGSIGISLLCAVGANTENLGQQPPTAKQIEMCAQVIATVADALDLSIWKTYVLTHGEAADNEDAIYPHEPYGPKNGCERWDLEFLGTEESPKYAPYDEDHRGGSVLRGKANWYRNTWELNGFPYDRD